MSVESDPQVYVVRNEVDPEYMYHCDALAARFPDAEEVDYPAGERVPVERADGVVLTGSTAGVYETDTHDWITIQEALVRELVEREIPTLGVCFGHQIVNTALGGTVEHVGTEAALVEATLSDDPLFDGLEPIVVSLHGDQVIDVGEHLEIISSAEHAPVFGTRHRTAPLWTVQFHPEITATLRDRLEADFDWEERGFDFGGIDGGAIFENFKRLVIEHRRERLQV
ncbi:type 1 glutamine amidotransferase [Halorubrum vacuolatum]|uniref:GMP synthase (Glutamine-hydrolysing) n=1 Tax=Halorubrum vacuolatum TaxID=63740 RepID=A0A238VFX4_HALVU|nr:type 1 glutamine amidotransferase [Halorubrum vacuolatum]SNR32593.1 GMP synthase (glutamine-hydrolysing) [Halorubrum vacuolatum]